MTMSMLLFGGLAVILTLSVLERLRERPHFDWSRLVRRSALFLETDLQVEGLARSGDLHEAIAMYQRLHRTDHKKAQRAVMLLSSGEREQAAAVANQGRVTEVRYQPKPVGRKPSPGRRKP